MPRSARQRAMLRCLRLIFFFSADAFDAQHAYVTISPPAHAAILLRVICRAVRYVCHARATARRAANADIFTRSRAPLLLFCQPFAATRH